MKPARYIFLNKGLGMSPGKCAAQAAHAEMLAMNDLHNTKYNHPAAWTARQEALWDKWFGDGHYVKYVMEAADSQAMLTTERYLIERGFETYLVIDEGRTEDTFMVPTAFAVELVDKDDQRISSIFSTFRLYKEKAPTVYAYEPLPLPEEPIKPIRKFVRKWLGPWVAGTS